MCGDIAYTAEGMILTPSLCDQNVTTRLTIPVDNYLAALCHCTDCQKVSIHQSSESPPRRTCMTDKKKWTGGAFTSNAVVPRSSFKVTKGNHPLI